MKSLFFIPIMLAVHTVATAATGREPLPYRTPAQLQDKVELLSPADIQLEGWLGERVRVDATNRLMTADLEPLLAGFRHKPGSHPWIGEHIGKWLHAATLAWASTGNQALRQRLDYATTELIKAQEPDGYLGTYVPEQRFGLYPGADWDVWSQKYCMVGLLTYYRFTGDEAALAACRKTADLLLRTFGPGKKSILSAGTHVGMAATAVLRQMVLLYRCTGDPRYLDFARYIVKSWDAPGGPGIVRTLLKEKQVNQVADAKAYEMLCNLLGLCELARATGDQHLLEPALIAWQDIVTNHLYLTGGASAREIFPADHFLPNRPGDDICETCVTVTWIQLNLQLLRLTGEARFANEIEKSLYNHLAAAQNPRGDDWCYYTPLDGTKQYDSGITCCHSSGPRGLALAPQTAYLRGQVNGADALLVSTFESSAVTTELGGETVTLEQRSQFPLQGESLFTVRLSRPARFAVEVRAAPWASPLSVQLNGQAVRAAIHKGWVLIPARRWSDGDSFKLKYTLGSRLVLGEYGNTNKAALTWGPYVLAYDAKRNPGLPPTLAPGLNSGALQRPDAFQPGDYFLFASQLREPSQDSVPAELVPFADAGRDGGRFRVWMAAPGVSLAESAFAGDLLLQGLESRSRPGNVSGSINDGDPESYVVTYDGRKTNEDWFAVTLRTSAPIARVVFVQGKLFHDGGWFDTENGKPLIQIRRQANGRWESMGELSDYPLTTSRDPGRLQIGQSFSLRLPAPVRAVAVRVVGKPASGDSPDQGFCSCGELAGFGR